MKRLLLFAALLWPTIGLASSNLMPLTGAGGVVAVSSVYHASCSQASSFIARTSGMTTARKWIIDSFICGTVSDGVWAKCDAVYAFAASTQTIALLNMVQNLYNATATGSPTFTTDIGFTGASAKYISSGFNPSTATTPNYVRDSASVSAWDLDSSTSTGGLIGFAASNPVELLPRYTDGHVYGNFNSSSGELDITTSTDASGFHTLNRTIGASFDYYKNGSFVITKTSASSVVSNDTMTFLNANSQYLTGKRIAAAAICGGLTAGNISAFKARWQTYLHAVGAI